jgi:hypothetical protein
MSDDQKSNKSKNSGKFFVSDLQNNYITNDKKTNSNKNKKKTEQKKSMFSSVNKTIISLQDSESEDNFENPDEIFEKQWNVNFVGGSVPSIKKSSSKKANLIMDDKKNKKSVDKFNYPPVLKNNSYCEINKNTDIYLDQRENLINDVEQWLCKMKQESNSIDLNYIFEDDFKNLQNIIIKNNKTKHSKKKIESGKIDESGRKLDVSGYRRRIPWQDAEVEK